MLLSKKMLPLSNQKYMFILIKKILGEKEFIKGFSSHILHCVLAAVSFPPPGEGEDLSPIVWSDLLLPNQPRIVINLKIILSENTSDLFAIFY